MDNWKDVVITMDGKVIKGIISIDYKNDNTFTAEIINHRKVTTIKCDSREELITYIKQLGIILYYGNGEYPISYYLPPDIIVPNVDTSVLPTITRDEWTRTN